MLTPLRVVHFLGVAEESWALDKVYKRHHALARRFIHDADVAGKHASSSSSSASFSKSHAIKRLLERYLRQQQQRRRWLVPGDMTGAGNDTSAMDAYL